MPLVQVGDAQLEVERIAATRSGGPSLLLLHEGLGSVSLWRDFPEKLAEASGLETVVYSRRGYGRSSRLSHPNGADYMHHEALETLPALRNELRLEDVILFGHSDGASIALIHAGAGKWPVRALVLEAPHVFVEEIGIRSIEAAKTAFESGELRKRLAKHHADVDGAFYAWNRPWLLPEFRQWNIEGSLPRITCPVLAIQGRGDAYGTLAQLEALEKKLGGEFQSCVLEKCGHSPHRDQEAATLEVVSGFVERVSRRR